MPPRPKVTRQMVLDAAFQLVREEGAEALSARAVAARLGCSTQPVMRNFATVEALREAVYQMADDYHTRRIMPRGRGSHDPLTELGLNYVRFGAEEPQLFRLLFQTNKFGDHSVDDLIADPQVGQMLALVEDAAGCTRDQARRTFKLLFVTAHGMASLLANNAMAYDEQECTQMLAGALAGVLGEEG